MKHKRKAILILLSLSCFVLIIAGLAWLSIGLLAVSILYWLTISDNLTIARFRKMKSISYPFYILAIFIFSIGIRLFLIEIYAIPSVSMEDTIISGDKILVNKLFCGPRTPASPFEIPIVNTAFYLDKKSRAKADSVWWEYNRLRGFSGFKRNQVIVFNLPQNPDEVLIKRCIGLPGDTVQIRNAAVYTNGRKLPEINTVKFFSRILFNNYTQARPLFDSIGIETYYNKPSENNYFSIYLNHDQKQALLTSSCIDSVIIEKVSPDTAFKDFTHNDHFRWTLNNFGPLVVPARGMTIRLNEENYILFRDVISQFEKTVITNKNGKILLDGAEATSFTFKNNYYFMLGDNRHNSRDSRYWGFIPEKFIIGKASMILFSNGEDGFRWKRFFKVIR
jgi:signal peptidase I